MTPASKTCPTPKASSIIPPAKFANTPDKVIEVVTSDCPLTRSATAIFSLT